MMKFSQFVIDHNSESMLAQEIQALKRPYIDWIAFKKPIVVKRIEKAIQIKLKGSQKYDQEECKASEDSSTPVNGFGLPKTNRKLRVKSKTARESTNQSRSSSLNKNKVLKKLQNSSKNVEELKENIKNVFNDNSVRKTVKRIEEQVSSKKIRSPKNDVSYSVLILCVLASG